ncbi:MAG: redox-regulated ATPase YchF [Planctomycetota bacterium]
MGFQCGIVGLPNVGKSTIFNALTSAGAAAANFPFCTIEPNKGIVQVPDPRLEAIARYIPTQKIIPTSMTFVDIAGLVRGASKGEGLGNQFLGHIRDTQAIAHVVRCFADPNVVHVDGGVDPIRDIEVIETELMLADLDSVSRRVSTLEKRTRGADADALRALAVARTVRTGLEAGKPVRQLSLSEEELADVRDLHLITAKPVLYIANIDESDLGAVEANPLYQRVADYAERDGARVIAICGKIEAEVAELGGADKQQFLAALGLAESGLDRVIRAGHELLRLQTFFTAGEKEVRAWTVPVGATAPQAAGVIHSDFERGFIRAEVYHFDDLMRHHSEAQIKSAGLLRVEGKNYVLKDGDVLFFRFSV